MLAILYRMNLPLQNLGCGSRCEEEQWEVQKLGTWKRTRGRGREAEREGCKQKHAYSRNSGGDHTSYLSGRDVGQPHRVHPSSSELSPLRG
jgi:hypothetical protein